MISLQYIPDLIATVVESAAVKLLESHGLNISYDWGNHTDIVRMLTEKDGNPNKPEKYPLIWLVTPFKEKSAGPSMYAKVDLRFIIANDTEQNFRMEERRDNVFLPILYPVMGAMVDAIKLSRLVQANPLTFEKTDIQLARSDSEGKSLFGDYADVIDITFSDILIRNKNC